MSVTYCPQISCYYHFSITYYSALYLLSNWLFSPFMEYDFWSQGTHLVHNSMSLTSWHKVGYQHSHLLFLFFLFSNWCWSTGKHFSVQFSHSVVSDSLWPHEPQHTRLPCPPPTPRVYPNSCPLSWWCHLTISSPVVPFSSCLQSFQTSRSFLMSQLFTSGGQSTGVSALTLVSPMNTQDQFPLGWTGWISLQSKGLSNSQESSPTPQFKSIDSSVLSPLYSPTFNYKIISNLIPKLSKVSTLHCLFCFMINKYQSVKKDILLILMLLAPACLVLLRQLGYSTCLFDWNSIWNKEN